MAASGGSNPWSLSRISNATCEKTCQRHDAPRLDGAASIETKPRMRITFNLSRKHTGCLC